MLDRNEALHLIRQHIHKENLVKHMVASEACMRKLAQELEGDPETWGMAGLLHDIDYELTADQPEKHGIKAMDLLPCEDLSPEILQAIKSHSGHTPCASLMDKALYAVDPITGLIVASVLMTPNKKLADLSTETVMKRYKEKRFAAGACREQIASCTDLGLSLEEFTDHCIQAMQSVAKEVGF